MCVIIKNNRREKIQVNRWNDGELYSFGKVKTIGDSTVNFLEKNTAFYSSVSKEKIVEENQKNYIGEIIYVDLPLEYEASLYYEDNNYYVLFQDEKTGIYWVQNCIMRYEMNGHCINIPSPVYILLSKDTIDLYQQDNQNVLDYFFNYYTYEKAKEFYERLSSDYVIFDDENQKIILAGKEISSDNVIKNFLTIDFVNRTMTGHEEMDILITDKN